MSQAAFELADKVRFHSLEETKAAGRAFIDAQEREAVFDLSRLVESNSAAVALLMSWLRYANTRGKTVRYFGIPVELRNIIEVSGLDDVLPTTEQA